MKKIILYAVLPVLVLISFSCQNSLNPNAPFRERNILTGVMRSDTTLQIVTLTHSYEPADGFNPYTNTTDPAIIGAEVNMWYRDTLYEMRDTTLPRSDTSQYKDSIHCYYVNNLRPEPNQYVDIEALLPNGLLLQSFTKTPDVSPNGFWDYNNDKVIPPAVNNFVYIKWKGLTGVLYSPKIVITYYKKGSTEALEYPVPLYYSNLDGVSTPIYPKQTKENSITLDMSTISRALNDLPNGESKSDFSIAEMNVHMIVYDENLSTYYSSIQLGADAFTVRLDLPDYSNVKGGFGVFGSYIRTNFQIKFTYDYLHSLGY